MRELYLAEDAKLVMVTHDWGSIIGARLASQAKELAHRWILVAGIIVSLPHSHPSL
jgi:pimeloyl-ACP methyl ester carboxylesterase